MKIPSGYSFVLNNIMVFYNNLQFVNNTNILVNLSEIQKINKMCNSLVYSITNYIFTFNVVDEIQNVKIK